MTELPACNRTLLAWLFTHMSHVMEKVNKLIINNNDDDDDHEGINIVHDLKMIKLWSEKLVLSDLSPLCFVTKCIIKQK